MIFNIKLSVRDILKWTSRDREVVTGHKAWYTTTWLMVFLLITYCNCNCCSGSTIAPVRTMEFEDKTRHPVRPYSFSDCREWTCLRHASAREPFGTPHPFCYVFWHLAPDLDFHNIRILLRILDLLNVQNTNIVSHKAMTTTNVRKF